MRRMSFSLTTDAVRERRKTVTRRRVSTWRTLHPGDRLLAVTKAQGLKRGEHQEILATIEVVSNNITRIELVSPEDVIREGFAGYSAGEFIDVLHHAMRGETHCRRIAFRYVDGGAS